MHKKIFSFVFFIAVLWSCVVCLFIADTISFNSALQSIDCDSVVVLTGGKNRILHALKAMDINIPKNVFISGVYEKSRLQDIVGEEKIKEGVHFILGKKAKNTQENALEVTQWVNENRIARILLVTSDYHMRRALFALKKTGIALEIIPYSCKSKYDLHFFVNCIKEFHKIIYMWFENLFLCKKEK